MVSAGKHSIVQVCGVLALLLGGAPALTAQRVHYVNDDASGTSDGSSWQNAFTDLQQALSSAQVGDQIWVAQGLYRPDTAGGDPATTFHLLDQVGIYGAFVGNEDSLEERTGHPELTVLSGDLNGNDPVLTDDNSWHVVTAAGTASTAILDGFRITGGNAPDEGGGIYVFDAYPTIRNCLIDGNRAPSGGGMSVSELSTSNGPLLVDCEFRDNLADSGGALRLVLAGGTCIERCIFTSNAASGPGGAILLGLSELVTIDDCVFEFNSAQTAGAIYMFLGSSEPLPIVRCVFRENEASTEDGGAIKVFTTQGFPIKFLECSFIGNRSIVHGGAVDVRGSASFVECVFQGNRSDVGGGLALFAGGSTRSFLLNCQILGSVAGQGGGIFASWGGFGSPPSLALTNCLLSGNTAAVGGALVADRVTLRVTQATFANNTATGSGGGVVALNGAAIVANSILWGNQGLTGQGESEQVQGDGLTVDTTCIQGLTGALGGSGNIGSDPLFLDASGPDGTSGTLDDNARLARLSPCVEVGNNTALPADQFDIDLDGNMLEPLPYDLVGAPRVADGDANGLAQVDLGCFEFPVTVAVEDIGSGEQVALELPQEGVDLLFENLSGTDGAGLWLSATSASVHPHYPSFGVYGTTAIVETSLPDGSFVLQVRIRFVAADLQGANPLMPPAQLDYYDAVLQDWVLGVEGNTQSSPGHAGPVGDFFVDEGEIEPALGQDLGDHGVFWNPVAGVGFVWANVDHTTEFANRLFQDCNADGLPGPCDSLVTDRNHLSILRGGTVTFELNAGPIFGGDVYLVLGSLSGTAPGTMLRGALVPLNVDEYFLQTLTAPDTPPLIESTGVLDKDGRGGATFFLPARSSPALAGLRFNHAFVVLGSGPIRFVSNPRMTRLILSGVQADQ